jgi:hypothetical protein
MATTTYKAGQRPRIQVRTTGGMINTLPNLVLTKINSKTAYFRSSHVIGELACPRRWVTIIEHQDGTPVLDSEQWPPLTPIDKGERLAPVPWRTHEGWHPEEALDRHGKVDFDNDSGESVLTLWVEPTPDGFVIKGYTHGGDAIITTDIQEQS